jgi:putative ABC transport system permease protein
LIRLFNLRHLRATPVGSLLAIAAVTAGVCMAVAVGLVASSITSSITQIGRQIAGASQLRIVGSDVHGGIPESVVDQVASTRGVAGVIPLVETVAMGLGPGVQQPVLVLGIDCSVERVVGNTGCDPAALAATANDVTPLVSPRVRAMLTRAGSLRTDLGVVDLGAAPVVSQLARINSGLVVVFPLPQAQRLFSRPDRVDVIYVTPAPQATVSVVRSEIVARIGSAYPVLSRDQPPPGLSNVEGQFLPLLLLVGLAALVLGAILIYGIAGLSFEERRRDLAIAGSLGATRQRLVGGALVEAFVLGAIAGLLGSAVSLLVAVGVLGSLARLSEDLLGIPLTLHLSPLLPLAGIAVGAGVAASGALGPAQRSTHLDLAAEIAARTPGSSTAPTAPNIYVLAGTLLVTVVGVILAWASSVDGSVHPSQPTLGYVGIVLTAIGAFGAIRIIAPGLVTFFLRLWRPFAASTGSLYVSALNVSRQTRRSGAIAIIVGTAVGGGASLGNFLPSAHAAIAKSYGAVAHGRVYVSTLGVNNTTTIDSKLSPQELERLRQIPGVAAVEPDYSTAALTPGGRSVVTVDASTLLTSGFSVVQGRRLSTADSGDVAVVGSTLARRFNLAPDSYLQLEAPSGAVELRIVGIWSDPDFGGAAATVPVRTIQRLWGPLPPTQAWVAPAGGVTDSGLATRIASSHIAPDLHVYTASQYADELTRAIGQFLAPFWLLQRGLLVVALLGTLATLLLVGVQRRGERGTLMALGMNRRQMATMILGEGLVAGTAGAVIGELAGLLFSLSLALTGGVLFGLRPPLEIDLSQAGLYLLIGTALVAAGALLPSLRTSESTLLEALRYE